MGDNESDLFLQKVVSYPNEIEWRNPHDVQLEKLSDDSVGVVFKTCLVPRVKETWTIIIHVKHKCHLLNSSTLERGSRITRINGCDVTKSNSAGLLKVLKSCKSKKGIITLRVYEPSDLQSLDIHVESQKLLNPLLDNSNSSSVSSVSAISQSEDIKLESLTKDRRNKNKNQLQLRTSKTAGSHSWYTPQSSNLSLGSDLTPVEAPETPISGGCTETTPLMAFSHVGGPSSLGSDAENIDVGKAALQNPCNIIWQSNTEKITLQKTGREEKVGFYYKIKKLSNDAELYVLVEKVDVGSPSHGKLHLGDWIRSVNGTPITDNKDLLKQEIKKSEREVTLVIQRPESILRPIKNNNNNRKQKESRLPELEVSRNVSSTSSTSSISPKSWPAEHTTNIDSRFSDLTATALDDIKIDGMSVYNGPVHYDPVPEPAIVISEPNDRTVPSFITGRDVIPTLLLRATNSQIPAVVSGFLHHRRNNSESSVAMLSKCLVETSTSSTRPTTSASDEEAVDTYTSLISDCTKHIARGDLQRRPYVRINQLSTSSHPRMNLTNSMLKALGIEGNSFAAPNHVFRVSRNGLDAVNSSSHLKKNTSVEDLIIAKYMAESFKCGNASIQEVRKALLNSQNKLLSGSSTLIESFMQTPPALDTGFVEVEIENFVYEDVLNLWPSVYFTSNAVYVIVFDYQLFISQPQEEIKRLQMCINLIHSSSSMTKIFLLCDNYPSNSRLDAIMTALSPIESALKVTNMDFNRCSNCGCNRKKVPPDAFSQIQGNKHSAQLYYLANRTNDWKEFVENIRDYICSGQSGYKFPLSAILAMKLLNQGESESMTTTTMTYFKQNIMQKILPGASELDALTALHQSGKVCWHSQVAHRTVHSNAHNMFILLRPHAIKESVLCVQEPQASNLSSSHRLTHQQLLNDCLSHLKYKDKDEVLMFLELYHVLEAVKSSEPQSEYYVVPQLIEESTSSLPALVKRYTASGKAHHTLFIDFHGLLPVNMCLSLLARLGEIFGGTSQIKSVCTGCFDYQGMSLLVQLIPYYGKAVILMTFDHSASKLTTEGTFHIIASAFKKAISSNLLTYHIGPECHEHMASQESMSLLMRADFTTLAQKVHILDAGESAMTTGQMRTQWNYAKNEAAGTNGLHIDLSTSLRDIPSPIEDCLCKGLNCGGGWKFLFESVGLTDWQMMSGFERSRDPTKALLSYLKTSSTCTLKDVVKLLQKRQRLDTLHKLMELGVSCTEL